MTPSGRRGKKTQQLEHLPALSLSPLSRSLCLSLSAASPCVTGAELAASAMLCG